MGMLLGCPIKLGRGYYYSLPQFFLQIYSRFLPTRDIFAAIELLSLNIANIKFCSAQKHRTQFQKQTFKIPVHVIHPCVSISTKFIYKLQCILQIHVNYMCIIISEQVMQIFLSFGLLHYIISGHLVILSMTHHPTSNSLSFNVLCNQPKN